MPLNEKQIAQLRESIQHYDFPCVYYDFVENRKITAPNMHGLEAAIGCMLRAPDINGVKDGLANVLYWGYAQTGYGLTRVNRFRREVTNDHLTHFQNLLAGNRVPNLIQVGGLGIPEFSGVSFVSKVLMFLNPNDYCVLDLKLAGLRTSANHRALSRLVVNKTHIRITENNQAVYDDWREECRSISDHYFAGQYRVVDVERGFFGLIGRRQ